jgi:L-ascorbate metabolism protein UlaG (beta-lactamase superfamily)
MRALQPGTEVLMRTQTRWVASALAAALGVSLAAQAKSQGNAATIAARSRIFGSENVDQRSGKVDESRVIFSWLTNSTYAVAAKGHVFLLDTFVTRLETTPGRTPIVIEDLVDLRPEALMLGHGHFDHADNAAFIAAETGAVIYASAATCDNMAIDATNNFNRGYTRVATVTCVSLTGRDTLPGNEIVSVRQFEPDIRISVFKHLHSTNTGADDPNAVPIAAAVGGVCQPTRTKGNTFPCNLADSRDTLLFPAGTPLSTVMNISTSRQGGGGPVALFFVFTVNGKNHFRFVWHNSTGDIVDSCALPNNQPRPNPLPNPPPPLQPFYPPQQTDGCFPTSATVNGKTVGANLAAIMDSLRPVDVQLGSVVSLGFNQNGERDTISYIAHLRPKVFIPAHVTAVAVESSSLEWKVGFFDALAAPSSFSTSSATGATYSAIPKAEWPEVPWLVDPNDYLRPLVYTPSDDRWAKGDRDHDHDDD